MNDEGHVKLLPPHFLARFICLVPEVAFRAASLISEEDHRLGRVGTGGSFVLFTGNLDIHNHLVPQLITSGGLIHPSQILRGVRMATDSVEALFENHIKTKRDGGLDEENAVSSYQLRNPEVDIYSGGFAVKLKASQCSSLDINYGVTLYGAWYGHSEHIDEVVVSELFYRAGVVGTQWLTEMAGISKNNLLLDFAQECLIV